MLLPIFAKPININTPKANISHAAFTLNPLLSSSNISDKPITSEPNKVLDNEKKYSASFSFLVRSFSLRSFFRSMSLLKVLIITFTDAKIRLIAVNAKAKAMF